MKLCLANDRAEVVASQTSKRSSTVAEVAQEVPPAVEDETADYLPVYDDSWQVISYVKHKDRGKGKGK